MPTSVQQVPYFLDYSQKEKGIAETHGASSHDKIYPCFQEKQILPENKNLQKQVTQTVPLIELPFCELLHNQHEHLVFLLVKHTHTPTLSLTSSEPSDIPQRERGRYRHNKHLFSLIIFYLFLGRCSVRGDAKLFANKGATSSTFSGVQSGTDKFPRNSWCHKS